MRRNFHIFIAALLLGALLLIVYSDVIFSDKIFVQRDIARYYFPLRQFAAESLQKGEIPLWNPYLFCGAPFHAAIQNAVFYPLSAVYYLADFAKGLTSFIILHIFLYGIFMYLFMGALGVSRLGSFLSGLVFMFSGYVIATIPLVPGLASAAWFPLAAFLFVKLVKKRRHLFSVLLAIVFALMFIAGDPAVPFAAFAILAIGCASVFFRTLAREKKLDFFIVKSFFIILVLFLLLTAFQVLPALEYFSRTSRVQMIWEEASTWSIPYYHLISLIVPYLNEESFFYKNFWMGQKWLDNYYVGIITLILAGFGMWVGRKKTAIRILFIIMLGSLFVCLGRNFFLYPLAYKLIPLFRFIRYPVRFFFIFTFALAALSGFGLDYMKRRMEGGMLSSFAGKALFTGFISVIAAVLITVFQKEILVFAIERARPILEKNPDFGIQYLPSLAYADLFNFRRTLLYLGAFGLFAFLWSRTGFKRIMPYIMVSIVGFDLLLTNTGFEHVEKISYFTKPTPNIRAVIKDKSLFRVFASPYAYDRFTWVRGSFHDSIEIAKDLFVTNRMMEFGLYDMWGYDSAQLRRGQNLGKVIYASGSADATNLLNLLNVKYITSRPDMEAEGFKKISETKHGAVFENLNCLPRAHLVRKIKYLKNEEEILSHMCSKDFNPADEVILSPSLQGATGTTSPSLRGATEGSDEAIPEIASSVARNDGAGDSVIIKRYEPHLVEINVHASSPAMLVLSDTYYPGWRAFVDEKEAKIYRADYFLRAVYIPAGSHRARFVYNTATFKIGACLTILALLCLAGLVVIRYTIIKY